MLKPKENDTKVTLQVAKSLGTQQTLRTHSNPDNLNEDMQLSQSGLCTSVANLHTKQIFTPSDSMEKRSHFALDAIQRSSARRATTVVPTMALVKINNTRTHRRRIG